MGIHDEMGFFAGAVGGGGGVWPGTVDTFEVTDTLTVSGDTTFTGTVSGLTRTTVGLGVVDNTADADKPVSTAQQTALDLKANLGSAHPATRCTARNLFR